MIKNAIAYRLTGPLPLGLDLAERLAVYAHREPGPLEERTLGFVPVQDTALHHCVNGVRVLALMEERKVIPTHALKSRLAAAEQECADTEARTMSRRERREAKDKIYDDLMTRALTSATVTHLLIDQDRGWLLVDTSSPARADACVSRLRQALGTLPARPFGRTDLALSLLLSRWADGHPPPDFSTEDDAQWEDGEESVIRVKGQVTPADLEAITHSRTATHLRVTWDNQLTCTLRADRDVRRLVYLVDLDEDLEPAARLDWALSVQGGLLMRLFERLAALCDEADAQSEGVR